MPSIAKKTIEEKVQKPLLSSFQKTKLLQTNQSAFADRVEQVKKIKFELELIKPVGCFLDGFGENTSNLVSLKVNFC